MAHERNLYSNRGKGGDLTENFFRLRTKPKFAYLASAFFSNDELVTELTGKGCAVQLIVRLSEATSPNSLKAMLRDPLVNVRYYTDHGFHPKLYIIDDHALVGSANLTQSGMRSNREVSVVLSEDRDEAFEQLAPLFETLWDYADVLTAETIARFEKLLSSRTQGRSDVEFQKELERVIDRAAPPTVRVDSEKVTKRRSFLQGFRRRYDEVLVPAYNEIASVFAADGRRRPDLVGAEVNIEITRFLSWVRVNHVPGEEWRDAPLLDGDERKSKLQPLLDDWHTRDHVWRGNGESAEQEIEKVELLRRNLGDKERLESLNGDEIFDTLIGLHAFLEQLRFSRGGLEGLRKEFLTRNDLKRVKSTFEFLMRGPSDILERAYDVIHDERYRLEKFGEACTMELVGWFDDDRPPINGRTQKVIRYLGFDVQ
ncbi:phospholipase D-like domain-containing protein [Hyphomonas sp.]|uniref:phospholipase D family protein n=1 Tax=Hyphomonas sp. TaxID=87 RepID=UPI00391D8E60